MEVFLQQFQGSFEQQNEDKCFQEGAEKYLEHRLNLHSSSVSVNRLTIKLKSQILYSGCLLFFFFLCISNFGLKSIADDEDGDSFDGEHDGSRPSDLEGLETLEHSLSAMKHQVDVLLEEWNKSADMLFSIHPIDGSLLVWHVDWLDEYQPGMFRQAQVCSFFM